LKIAQFAPFGSSFGILAGSFSMVATGVEDAEVAVVEVAGAEAAGAEDVAAAVVEDMLAGS